jgi:hypothetical protein
MKYYKVTDRGDMSPIYAYDGRKKKTVSKGFLIKNQLLTEREYKKFRLTWREADEIELKKNRVKLYPDGLRFEKAVN